jgi:hypothetical protein
VVVDCLAEWLFHGNRFSSSLPTNKPHSRSRVLLLLLLLLLLRWRRLRLVPIPHDATAAASDTATRHRRWRTGIGNPPLVLLHLLSRRCHHRIELLHLVHLRHKRSASRHWIAGLWDRPTHPDAAVLLL